jgi:hypothetical protein
MRDFKPGFVEMLHEFKSCFVEKKRNTSIGSRLEDIVWINKFIEEMLE